MTGLAVGLFVAALWSAHPVASVPASLDATDWTFNGNAASCLLESAGRASDAVGAQLDVRCDQGAQILGNVLMKVPAAALHQRRVTITAEVHVASGMDASLWLKTSHGNATLLFENDAEQALFDTGDHDGWSLRTISLPVAADATTVSYGVLLQGRGEAAVRNLRVAISQPGAMDEAAQHVLDAALDIVKRQTAARRDLQWRVLETDVRLLASGAQQTADVYPAIKYLLAQLGDRRSLLLTPELAAAFTRASDTAVTSATARVQVFTLPDGANLVLSLADVDTRVARNWDSSMGAVQ